MNEDESGDNEEDDEETCQKIRESEGDCMSMGQRNESWNLITDEVARIKK